MKHLIGFAPNTADPPETVQSSNSQVKLTVPKKSVVQIYFPDRHITLSYYNDTFDLHCGDIVYVDGKLEGLRGRVVEVNYNFKIKRSDYKRVISVADTAVRGQFYLTDSHFITFDSAVLPFEKVNTWFHAPEKEEAYVSGYDDSSFDIETLAGLDVNPQIACRGHEYYAANKVVYLCIDNTTGCAIVEGSQPYITEFQYHNGSVSGLVCSCFCGGICKHEIAVMLQLRDILDTIKTCYTPEYSRSHYFAAISKSTLFTFAFGKGGPGSLLLGP